MVFYDMGDNIHNNRNDKNNGEKFKEIDGNPYNISIASDHLKTSKWQNKGGKDNYTTKNVAEMVPLSPFAAP